MKQLDQTKKATTQYPGIVQLTNSINSSSETLAPTAKALAEVNAKVDDKISVVISPPYISVPTTVSTGISFTALVLQGEYNYSEVISYNVRIDGGELVTYDKSGDITQIPLTVLTGVLGEEVIIEIQSVDSLGNKSEFREVKPILSTNIVLGPQLSNLFDNQTNVETNPTIQVNPFVCYPTDFATIKETNNFSIVLKDVETNNIVQQKIMTLPYSGGSFTFDTPTFVDTKFELTLKWITETEENVESTVINYTTIPAYIQNPTIANIPNNIYRGLIEVRGSNFISLPSTFEETHTATDWKLLNAADSSVIVEKLHSSDLLSTIFSVPTLPSGTQCKVSFRYVGDKLPSTDWIESNSFTVTEKLLSPSGRYLYPTEDGNGIVIEYKDYGDGQKTKRFAVAKAIHRTARPFIDGTPIDIPELTNYTTPNSQGNWYLDGVNSPLVDRDAWPSYLTDQQLYNLWYQSWDAKTAKQNTDIWYSKASETHLNEAIYTALNCRINNSQCAIPNIQQLMIIACEADNIDTLDDTLNDAPLNALGGKHPVGYFRLGVHGFSWSSTEFDLKAMRLVSWAGSCGHANKLYSFGGVIPILELA